jgi:rod shape-determining protein MreB
MSLLDFFFRFSLYIQISPDRLTVRNPRTGAQISEVPELAITSAPKVRVVAVGTEARSKSAEPNVKVINPFAHPRTLVSDFTAGQQLIKAFIAKTVTGGIFAVSPSIVMHPLGDPAGGYTQIEVRALQELALGAGARSAKVWQGRPLTDQELLSGSFPASGKLLA